jgi:hypothetical protein
MIARIEVDHRLIVLGLSETTMRILKLAVTLVMISTAAVAQGPGDMVRRDGDLLELKLQNGKFKTYQSDRKACENHDAERCVIYELRAYLPSQNAFVIEGKSYEGGAHWVVSRKTGRAVQLETRPEFSPTGKRFVSVNGAELGSHSYDVAIWVMTPDEPKLEFRYETPQGDRYELWEFRGWNGEDRINLEVKVGNAMVPFESEAVRTAAGWQIKRPPQSN